MSPPFFSIVVPSYNQGRYLDECLKSILAQSFTDFELLLMDGGSSDESITIIRKYEPFFKYWRSHPDAGQADALCEGFSLSTGKYLMWLNSDDILMPGTLSSLYEIITRNIGLDFIYSNMLLVSADSSVIGERLLTPLPPILAKQAVSSGFFGFYQPSAVWSSSSYKAVGGIDPNLQFAMDNDLFIRIVNSVPITSILFVDLFTSSFRIHECQKTLTITDTGVSERSRLIPSAPWGYTAFLRFWTLGWRLLWYSTNKRLLRFLISRFSSNLKDIP